MSFKKPSKVRPAIRWIYERTTQLLRTDDGQETPLTPARLPKEEWISRVHPEDRDRIIRGFESLIKQENDFFEVYRMRDEEGRYHWVLNVGQWLGDRVVGRVFLLPDLILRMKDALPFFPLPSAVLFENQILWANLPFAHLLHHETPMSLMGRPLAQFISSKDHDKVEEALAGSSDLQFEAELEATPGTTQPVRIYLAALFGGQYHVATLTPVRQPGHESEKIATYERFFENDLTGDFLSTPEGQFLLCNPAFAQILGYESVEEVLQVNARSLYRNPKDREALLERLQKEKKIVNFEVELVRKDGSPIHVLENIVGIFDQEGRLVQIQGTLIDITDRKQAELRLKQQESQIRRLVESLQEGLLLINLDGVVTYANPRAHEILKHPPGELLGKKLSDLIPDPKISEKILSGKSRDSQFIVEIPMPPHETRILQISVSPYWSEEGQQTGLALLFLDVTEQKRREREAQVAQKEAEALQSLYEALRGRVYLHEISDAVLRVFLQHLQAQGGVVLHKEQEESARVLAVSEFPEELVPDLLQWLEEGFFHQEAPQPLILSKKWLMNLLPQERHTPLRQLEALIAFPLTHSGRPWGVLVLSYETEGPFPEGWARIGSTIAREATTALSTASLLHALEERTKELILLDKIHQELSTILDPEEALRKVIQTVVDEMEYVLGYSVVFDPKRKGLSLTYLYPMDERFEVLRQEFGIEIGPDAFLFPVEAPSPLLQKHFAGEMIKGKDLSALYHPVWDRRQVRMYQTLLGIRSYIKVPIMVEGMFHTSLLFASPRPEISPSEERTLRSIADRLGVVLSRAQLVKQIVDSEEKYRRLIYKMREGLMVFDEKDRITFVNPRICEILGMTAEELLQRSFLDLLEPNVREEVLPHLEKRRLGISDSYTITVKRKDGSVRTLRVHGSPLYDEDHNYIGSFAVIDDITDLTTLEHQLIHAQKMESIGRLAGGVAHDFNNILTIIAGNADLIHQRIHQEDPIFPFVEQIRKAAKKGAELTKRLLLISRRKVARPEVVNVNSVVEDMRVMLHRIIGEQIRLQTDLSPNLWPIFIEPSHLETVILNLVTNARDAMPTGGTITIRTENVVVREPIHGPYFEIRPGEYVMLSVSDTGVGMTEEVLQHIFEPFFTTKEAGKGTGLGLSTVYGIVRQSQGAIQVETAVGKGTTFRIYFPRGPEKEGKEAQAVKASIDSLHGAGIVVVVEDDESVRHLMAQVIKGMGFHVLEAKDAAEAVKIVQTSSSSVKLMVTDFVLPDMRGEELARVVLEHQAGLKILFVSGYFPEDLGITETEHGFLQKPFTPDQLRGKIRELLREG